MCPFNRVIGEATRFFAGIKLLDINHELLVGPAFSAGSTPIGSYNEKAQCRSTGLAVKLRSFRDLLPAIG